MDAKDNDNNKISDDGPADAEVSATMSAGSVTDTDIAQSSAATDELKAVELGEDVSQDTIQLGRETSQEINAPRKRFRVFGFVANAIIILLVLCVGLGVGGFFRFANGVAALKAPENFENAEAIIVLTGGKYRIPQAVDLLQKGVGERLFISGVNPDISRADLLRVSNAQAHLFDCCIDVGRDAIDTIGNAREVVPWLAQYGYKTVVLVTSDYHMLRSLEEFKIANQNVSFIAYPISMGQMDRVDWFQNPKVVRTLFAEYLKINLTVLRRATGVSFVASLYSEQSPKVASLVAPKI